MTLSPTKVNNKFFIPVLRDKHVIIYEKQGVFLYICVFLFLFFFNKRQEELRSGKGR